ncbi:MAG: GNAT family N-acetyltransferase, partial [Herbaspirillum sp.]
GRALIEELYRYAAADGAERVYWHTHHTNATARKLYDHLAVDSGFIVYRKNLR